MFALYEQYLPMFVNTTVKKQHHLLEFIKAVAVKNGISFIKNDVVNSF